MSDHRQLLTTIVLTALICFFPLVLFCQDTAIYIDANRILMYAGNDGILANDFFREIGTNYGGFYYNGDTSCPAIWSSGLWIVGKISGDYGTSMAYYKSSRTYSEFAPGPYPSQGIERKRLRVYKITSEDLVTPGDDWNQWPVDLGAPVDSLGNPLLLGDQTLFSVYNDADTSRRDYTTSSPEPIYSEVRQLVFAYDKEKYLGDVVFVRLEIINRSSKLWDSLFVGIYADPDLGLANNDLVGSYEKTSLAYGYSDKFDEEMEETGYNVAGLMILGGSLDETDNNAQYTAVNTDPSSFYPTTSEQAFFMLRGLDDYGNSRIDPTGSEATYSIYNGDPRYEVGWIDDSPGDKSFVISRGPYRISSGKKLIIDFAYVGAVADNKKDALTRLFTISEKAADWHKYGAGGINVSGNSMEGKILSADFTPDYQNWILGVPFQGDFSSSGIGKASAFLGSSLSDSELGSVDLEFSYDYMQNVYYYYHDDNIWKYAGYLAMPVRAFDSEEKQLDMIYLSENGYDCDFCFINPEKGEDNISRLLITDTEYSRYEKEKYISDDILGELGSLDLQYLLQFRPSDKNRVVNIIDGQVLSIKYSIDNTYAELEEIAFGSTPVSLTGSSAVFAKSEYNSSMNIRAEISNPLDFFLDSVNYFIPAGNETPVYIDFNPHDQGECAALVRLYNEDFEEYFNEFTLGGTGTAWPLDGDINLNGWLETADIALYIGYLYGDRKLTDVPVDLDLDNSGKIDIADIVTLINFLFFSTVF